MQANFMLVKDLIWTLLPFFFAWVIYQLKRSKLNMDRLVYLIKRADEIVEWIEEEYPDLPYVDKIDRIIDILIKQLKDAGYNVGDRQELERVAKAAYHRYKRNKLTLDRLIK